MVMNTIFNTFAQTEHVNAYSVLRSIKVQYFSLVLGLLAFAAVAFYISESDYKLKFDTNDTILIAAIILLFFVIPIGYFVSKAIWNKIEINVSLKEKVIKYQPGFLIRLATCEGVGLFSLVGFLLSNNLMHIIITLITLLIIFYYFPSSEKVGLAINLTQAELDDLRNKNYHQNGQ
jgi:hypothetical protein